MEFFHHKYEQRPGHYSVSNRSIFFLQGSPDLGKCVHKVDNDWIGFQEWE